MEEPNLSLKIMISLFLTLLTGWVKHMEKKKFPHLPFSIFPLISRPTINHPSVMLCPHSQNETLRKALPLGEFQIDSVTSQHCFPPTDCEGLLALSFFMICTLCFQSHHSWPEAKPSSYLFVST